MFVTIALCLSCIILGMTIGHKIIPKSGVLKGEKPKIRNAGKLQTPTKIFEIFELQYTNRYCLIIADVSPPLKYNNRNLNVPLPTTMPVIKCL